jgi:hypothetical protein
MSSERTLEVSLRSLDRHQKINKFKITISLRILIVILNLLKP